MRFLVLTAMIGLLAAGGSAMSRREVAGLAAPQGQGSPAASCASAGCHGGGEVGRAGSEQSTWAAGDPHAKAYGVLFNETSRRMMKNLHRSKPAHQDAQCLACHTAGTDVCLSGEAASDGVGCDGCHGPSKNWIARHYEPGWKNLSDREKFDLGFRNTKNLVTRITACTSCHVGDHQRDVNHDLIAAGHPRMAFEAARFHELPNYRQHWVENIPARDFEIRTWFIGQIADLQRAIERARISDPSGSSPRITPELSDFSCFACHRSLNAHSIGTEDAAHWQTWNTSLVTVLADMNSILFPGSSGPDITKIHMLQKAMNDKSTAISDREAKGAFALRDANRWLEALGQVEKSKPSRKISDADLCKLALAVAESARQAPADWDVLAQHYLALAAFFHADGKTLADIREPLEKLKDLVKYQAGCNSPAKFDVAETRKQFKNIAEILTPRAAP